MALYYSFFHFSSFDSEKYRPRTKITIFFMHDIDLLKNIFMHDVDLLKKHQISPPAPTWLLPTICRVKVVLLILRNGRGDLLGGGGTIGPFIHENLTKPGGGHNAFTVAYGAAADITYMCFRHIIICICMNIFSYVNVLYE